MTRRWTAVLARMGVPTGDGRILDPVGGSSRELPLPLMWQMTSSEGHGGAQVVGRIETMAFGDGMVTATGTILESADYALGVIEQLEAGVIGPSVDLDDIEYVMDDRENLVLTKWRVAGATLVAIPAFEGVSLTLDPETFPGDKSCLPGDPDPRCRDEYAMEVTEGTPYLQDFSAALCPEGCTVDHAHVVMPEGRTYTGHDYSLVTSSVLSSAAPVLPPLAWFSQPDVDRLTPLTVSDTGRVFGHIAGRDTCHVGLPGCVTPPMGYSAYEYFHVSEQRTQEGVTVPVGTFVAGPRHADPQLAFQAAQAHYDDPSAAVARVMVGEDEFGIWAAGWVLPSATEAARQTFMSSPVSGDWRRIGGRLELVAVCSVNTPGFPVPRARVAFASEAQRTLIAAGFKPQVGEPVEVTEVTNRSLQARARWAWATTGMEG